jgi:hypothetical protein
VCIWSIVALGEKALDDEVLFLCEAVATLLGTSVCVMINYNRVDKLLHNQSQGKDNLLFTHLCTC